MYDWAEKAIDCELCKRLRFKHTTKWYMHQPDVALEDETHKILLDFDI